MCKEYRSKISTLWIVVMFNMIFADILSFFEPGALAELTTGIVDGITFTSELMLIMAVILQIPIIMIFLSKVLGRKVNRPLNIIAGILTILFIVLGGSLHLSYMFFSAVEIACILLIFRYVWKWPKKH